MSNPREREPIVRRAVIRVGATRRQRLLRVLEYVEFRHQSIDEDMYRIDLGQVAALNALFTVEDSDEAEIRVSFTHDDVFALSIIVDAVDYCTRSYKETIHDVGDPELADLRNWVANAERWFIIPLKKP